MPHSAIAVLTFKSSERILGDGGTQSWKLKPKTAEQFDYVVCTRNSTTRNSEGPEPHRSAFLIGKISTISPSTESGGRFRICFSQYAVVSIPNVWGHGWRNPVRYTTLEELGINVETLEFKPVDPHAVSSKAYNLISPLPAEDTTEAEDGDIANLVEGDDEDMIRPLSISAAKAGLSLGLGVPESAIEISIKY